MIEEERDPFFAGIKKKGGRGKGSGIRELGILCAQCFLVQQFEVKGIILVWLLILRYDHDGCNTEIVEVVHSDIIGSRVSPFQFCSPPRPQTIDDGNPIGLNL